MKTGVLKINFVFILILVLLSPFLPSCKGGNAAALPIIVSLSFSEPPDLGKDVTIHASISLSPQHMPEVARGVTAKLKLTEGFELIEGKPDWYGDLTVGQTHVMTARIRAINTGNWTIAALAAYSPGAGAYEAGSKTLYIVVTNDSAIVNDTPPNEPIQPVPTNAPTQ